jgi:hypothetical protein
MLDCRRNSVYPIHIERRRKMQTYFIQAIQAQRFEDLYVRARNEAEALRKARKMTTLDARWVTFAF